MTDPAEIELLERRLLEPAFRKSHEQVAAVLSDAFREFAGSGRVYDKADTLETLADSPPTLYTLSDFKAVIVADDVVLATYKISSGTKASLRSSLWKKLDGRWQLVFHQGTPCAPQ